MCMRSVVNTKVDVRLHVDSAEWVPERVKERLKTMVSVYLTNDALLCCKVGCIMSFLQSSSFICLPRSNPSSISPLHLSNLQSLLSLPPSLP